MVKKFFTALYADKNRLYFDEDSGNVVFNSNDMSILNIDLDNFNLDHNFDKDYLGTNIYVKLLTWNIKFENGKHLEKN